MMDSNTRQQDNFDANAARSLLDQLITDSKLYYRSADYKALLDFVVRLRDFAPFNALLLHIQKPGLSYAASARDWRERFGRAPKNGARPLVILWPFGPVAFVYDVLDTEGKRDLPEDVASYTARGPIEQQTLNACVSRMHERGIFVDPVDAGDCSAGSINIQKRAARIKDSNTYRMSINRNHPLPVQFTTVAHELAHLFLGRPPEADRQIVFLGDFIDRGPHNARVLRTVRELVESERALAIMGNHELNAIHYHSIDPETGKPFKAHTERNQSTHESFLAEFPMGSSGAKEAIKWFANLPLWMDVGPFRVIHACWSDAAVDRLRSLAPDGVLPYERLIGSGRKSDPIHSDVSLLTKGPEVRLPEGGAFRDGGGQVRDEVRLAWWRRNVSTWREAVVSVPDPSELPDSPISEHASALLYPEDAKPLFFGHYWMTGSIALEAPNAICLDYSAARGGPLISYRFSPDDRGLSLSNIVA